MVDETSGVGEMCRGDAITGDKLDGAEGMRGELDMQLMNRAWTCFTEQLMSYFMDVSVF